MAADMDAPGLAGKETEGHGPLGVLSWSGAVLGWRNSD